MARKALAQGDGLKVILTNDDGWAVAQIRAEYDALRTAGFNVVFLFFLQFLRLT